MEHRSLWYCDWLVTWFNLDGGTLKNWLGLVNKSLETWYFSILCCLEGLSLHVLLLSHLLPLLFLHLTHCPLFVMHFRKEYKVVDICKGLGRFQGNK